MDSIINLLNWTFDAIMSYNAVKQGKVQTVEDFAAYLNMLELELWINNEEL
mgnify:CR=1 FL=1